VKLFALAIAAAIALAPAAFAQPSDETGAAPVDTSAITPTPVRHNRRTDPNARRCVSTTTVGSRLSRRVCRTNAEWEEIEGAASRQAAERGGAGPGFRCDGDPSMCNGSGRTQVEAGSGRSMAGGQ
jgi:hypothetical protein